MWGARQRGWARITDPGEQGWEWIWDTIIAWGSWITGFFKGVNESYVRRSEATQGLDLGTDFCLEYCSSVSLDLVGCFWLLSSPDCVICLWQATLEKSLIPAPEGGTATSQQQQGCVGSCRWENAAWDSRAAGLAHLEWSGPCWADPVCCGWPCCAPWALWGCSPCRETWLGSCGSLWCSSEMLLPLFTGSEKWCFYFFGKY